MGNLSTKAFTLIEILIVIVVIWILASSIIPRVTGMQDKAKYIRVQKDADNFRIAVYEAQNNTKKPLKDITWTLGTYFPCNWWTRWMNNADFKNFWPTSACAIRRKLSLQRIEAAVGYDSGSLSYLETDSWWQPYALIEIDWLTAYSANSCLYWYDIFRTVWPDWYYLWHNPGKGLADDDRSYNIPWYFCSDKAY